MGCDISRKQLSSYLDGECSTEMRERIDAHLQACPSCLQMYEEMAETWAAIAVQEVEAPTPFYFTRLEGRLQTALQKRSGQPSWLVALCVGVALVLGFVLGSATGSHWAERDALYAQPQLSTTVTDFSEDSLVEIYWQLAQVE